MIPIHLTKFILKLTIVTTLTLFCLRFLRQQPIPPPSHPRQYRAIGLVSGQYYPSQEQLTKGNLVTSEGITIETVMLGRLISVLKKHLDLNKSHLWVVYPRISPKTDNLHLQLVGVWQPELVASDHPDIPANLPNQTPETPTIPVKDGYFSIRGEVIYYAPEEGKVIVKIKQSTKERSHKPKSFKVKLRGTLAGKPLNRFWDFQVCLQGDNLVIEDAMDLGFARVNIKTIPSKIQKTFAKPREIVEPKPTISESKQTIKPKTSLIGRFLKLRPQK